MKNTLRVLRAIYDNPANRDNRLTPFLRMIGWQAYKRIVRRSINLPVFDSSIQMRCYPNSNSCSSVIYANGGLADYHEMSFMKHYLRKGDAFLDIGANAGMYTLFAASLIGAKGKVLAVEAAQKSIFRLREQIELNHLEQIVKLYEGALSNRTGTLDFTTDYDCMNQISTDGSGENTVTVPCERLDQIVADGQSFAMAKIDVEGAEPMVFEGAESLLSDGNPPVWILEVNGRLHDYGYTAGQLEKQMNDKGYIFALYDSDARMFIHGSRLWEQSQNLFAISEKHMDEVKRKLSANS